MRVAGDATAFDTAGEAPHDEQGVTGSNMQGRQASRERETYRDGGALAERYDTGSRMECDHVQPRTLPELRSLLQPPLTADSCRDQGH